MERGLRIGGEPAAQGGIGRVVGQYDGVQFIEHGEGDPGMMVQLIVGGGGACEDLLRPVDAPHRSMGDRHGVERVSAGRANERPGSGRITNNREEALAHRQSLGVATGVRETHTENTAAVVDARGGKVGTGGIGAALTGKRMGGQCIGKPVLGIGTPGVFVSSQGFQGGRAGFHIVAAANVVVRVAEEGAARLTAFGRQARRRQRSPRGGLPPRRPADPRWDRQSAPHGRRGRGCAHASVPRRARLQGDRQPWRTARRR